MRPTFPPDNVNTSPISASSATWKSAMGVIGQLGRFVMIGVIGSASLKASSLAFDNAELLPSRPIIVKGHHDRANARSGPIS
jgi:hypothetical protein